VVKKGDNLSSIARANGLKNWRSIYNHQDNKAFRKKRPDPNLIYPGDVIWLPTS
jgi:N-acetylmuramoyl-L-alanine amidase